MFNWDNFRILAEDLKQKEDEASQRTSISRLYYAVYWNARNFLEKDGFQVRDNAGKGVHEQVWGEFNRREGTTNKAIYRNGDELKKNRVKADYWAEIQKPKELVEDSFRIAQNALSYLKQIVPKGGA
jgi:uncharacterized protein (UPF0332 family)